MKNISLSGIWQFALDYNRKGIKEKWYQKELEDKIKIPGTTDEGGYGEYEEPNLRNLNRKASYMGYAWYKTTVEIAAEDIIKKELFLNLERCLWDTTVWINGIKAGEYDSLTTPHIYRITGLVNQGVNVISVLVDNSNLKTQESEYSETEDFKHLDLTYETKKENKRNCGGHHTTFLMRTNWNGIIGDVSIEIKPQNYIKDVRIFTKANLTSARIEVDAVCTAEGKITVSIENSVVAEWPAEQGSANIVYPDFVKCWDEFIPALYDFSIKLECNGMCDEKVVKTGIRYLSTKENALMLNGNRVFMRGTLEDCTFPLTFAPAMDCEYWEKIMRTVKQYGLNHIRFHTFCPPEAAFASADKYGVYLQPELPGTSCPSSPEEKETSDYLEAELIRILKTYGNHPSFCFLSMGNEQIYTYRNPEATENIQKKLMYWIDLARNFDDRHLYTGTSHSYSNNRNDDYFVSAWGKIGWDRRVELSPEPFRFDDNLNYFLTGIRWGGPDPNNKSVYCMYPPAMRDYDGATAGMKQPVISHEVGQWSVYPNVEEIPKYTGVLEPGNLKIIKESLRKNNKLKDIKKFVAASGKLALLLYREEIETALRSESMSGFQLLDLIDYPGQGTSTVGILDAFWDTKGLITAEKFREFCAPTVLLLNTDRRIYTSDQTFESDILVASYTAEKMPDACIEWSLGQISSGVTQKTRIKQGGITNAGKISIPLKSITKAEQITLILKMGSISNSWSFWVYPERLPVMNTPITSEWSIAEKLLNEGENVIFTPRKEALCNALPGVFTTAFWNPQMKKQTGTMGVICDVDSGAFKDFPTEFHTNWQWWDIIQNSSSIVLEGNLSYIKPLVQVIDTFLFNRQLALCFEVQTEHAKLIVCAVDIEKEIGTRHATRQFMYSLSNYINTKHECENRFSTDEISKILLNAEGTGA